MHYLILTPDGVGSTILQRLLTMALYIENEAVRNTHELTNGLELVDGVVTKNFAINYDQTLSDIQKLVKLSEPKVTLVSRLAKYHIDAREDKIEYQENFYKFLNQKYNTIIMCERKNIFEYALSWSIREKSGILNIYSQDDRQKVLEVSEVDEDYFLRKCREYVAYTKWIDANFPNVQKVTYEQLLTETDQVLEKFTGYRDTFQNKFGSTLTDIIKYEYDAFRSITNKEKNVLNNEQIKSLAKYRLLAKNMLEKNIIVSMPLKNTTLKDKQKQIKNFDACLNKFYNFAKEYNWIDQSTATYDFWNNTHVSN